MKKTNIKRLQLKSETVMTLARHQLRGARGAAVITSVAIACEPTQRYCYSGDAGCQTNDFECTTGGTTGGTYGSVGQTACC